MKILLLLLFLFCVLMSGCYSSQPDEATRQQNNPQHSVLSQNEPINFTGEYAEAFFTEWFAKETRWPTQADVDAWETAKGYR